jgi:hypothetical protein
MQGIVTENAKPVKFGSIIYFNLDVNPDDYLYAEGMMDNKAALKNMKSDT